MEAFHNLGHLLLGQTGYLRALGRGDENSDRAYVPDQVGDLSSVCDVPLNIMTWRMTSASLSSTALRMELTILSKDTET